MTKQITWSEASEGWRDYCRDLVADFYEDHPHLDSKPPNEVTGEDIRRDFMSASAYFRTDDPEIIFEG